MNTSEDDETSDYYKGLEDKRREKFRLHCISGGFNAQELLEYLEKIPKEQRVETAVYIRLPDKEDPFKMGMLCSVFVTPENGFFDLDYPILMLNTSETSPKV